MGAVTSVTVLPELVHASDRNLDWYVTNSHHRRLWRGAVPLLIPLRLWDVK